MGRSLVDLRLGYPGSPGYIILDKGVCSTLYFVRLIGNDALQVWEVEGLCHLLLAQVEAFVEGATDHLAHLVHELH